MIEIIEPYPAIYIPEIDAIVIADLHLGYEGIMAEQGMFIPKVQFKKEMQMLEKIIEKQKATRIIINGDLKHEFSETSYHEFREVSDLLEFLEKKFKEVFVIKGNHDNFIARVTKRFKVKLCDELELGNFCFLHGHRVPKKFKKAKHVIIAHEHPAIALFDEIGAKEKINCFLLGEMMRGRKIVVLPAFSPLAYGSEVNVIPSSELLSPVLKGFAGLEKMRVIGISEETGCLDFGELGRLRRI